jgi:hypothetical protein
VDLETNLKLRKFFHRDEQGTVKRNTGFKKKKKGKDGENS